MKMLKFLCSFLLFCFIEFVYADVPVDTTAAEDWFNDDSELRIEAVNEGELKFIAPITHKNILHSRTVLTISNSSLQTGWVDMQQCYRNLDRTGKVDVVYRYKNIEKLNITSKGSIGYAKVNKQTIHLEDIEALAHLCVQARVQILEKIDKQNFTLSNGPYHRKFFDGYYPYHVSLSIRYPADSLQYSKISPQPQTLFNVKHRSGELGVDTWFEGVLLMNIKFQLKSVDGK